MPPKAAKSANGESTDPNFAFVLSALRHAGEIKMNWDKVAEDNGIGYGKNASSKFKTVVKKQGFKFEGNIITPLDDTPAPARTLPAMVASKFTAPRKRKVTTKKEDGDDAEEESKTVTKRKKAAPKSAPKVKEEEEEVEAEDDDEDVKEEDEI
ncbi:hypothetical protein EDD36DRAFT_486831 [Exophiala viscosa]|uniref:Myb-like DNA-binding domain-containing protein n=1 Tax=Exophiala viscosa TaxID=2486360 RepID=A0AAN6IG19_9EURO|nr:hypothetical protein EDD36DRAFT_486831 [Exophiala viscosa]